MSASFESLARLLFPEGIWEYFDLINIHQDKEEIWFYLEEINKVPEEYKDQKLISKGFLPESSIQDFPLRGKPVTLFVKRRRWLNTTTGELVTRNWNLVAEGTRMTQEFASFLKEISRYRPNKL
jgi:hypothetical protein